MQLVPFFSPSNLDKLSNRMKTTLRITKTENRISEGEDRTTSLEGKVAELEPRVSILTDWAEDSENGSHRDNIRVIGLKEGTEGRQADLLGLETKQETIKTDIAHRALGPPKENSNRPVFIKQHNFSDNWDCEQLIRGGILDKLRSKCATRPAYALLSTERSARSKVHVRPRIFWPRMDSFECLFWWLFNDFTCRTCSRDGHFKFTSRALITQATTLVWQGDFLN